VTAAGFPGGYQATVSVVAAVTDGERHLAETIGTVLEQTEPGFELVLLDNASSDGTHEIMRSFADPRIRVERTGERLSRAEARNRAIGLSRAPLVKTVTDGDLLHPRCLELQTQPLLDDPGLTLVAARRHVVDDASRVLVPRRGLNGLIGTRSGDEVARKIVRSRSNLIGDACNVTFRRESFTAAGGWRGRRDELLDLDCWLRLLHHGDFLGRPEPLAAVRITGTPRQPGYAERVRGEHGAIVAELGDSPAYEVRAVDRLVGAALAPAGAVRRSGLSALATRSEKRQERERERALAAS
jgi:glycosyltransferase involved in cell wall biosynthesis